MVGYVHNSPRVRLGDAVRTDRLYAWGRRVGRIRHSRAADGREKNHSIVVIVVSVILVASGARLYYAGSKVKSDSSRVFDLNPDFGWGSSQHDVGTDLTIAQGIPVSEVNEAILVTVDQVERIICLRENHRYLRAALLGIGAGSAQESNRERDSDKESTGGKLGCGCHGIALQSHRTPRNVNLCYCGSSMGAKSISFPDRFKRLRMCSNS